MITLCPHDWEQIACVYRAEVAPADWVSHTTFILLGCPRCRTVDAFPVSNAALATARFIATLRVQLAAGGWLLPQGIEWRAARAR